MNAKLGDIASECKIRVESNCSDPVYAVTKHQGFVPSVEYFKKQVFSKDTKGYKQVHHNQFAYATIHLDEGSLGLLKDEKCIISPMYTVFEVDQEKVFPEYLYYQLKSPKAVASYQYLGKGSVHRRKSISFTRLSELDIFLPPLPEQKRIAAILDEADAIRRKRQQAIKLANDFLRSMFLDMFGDSNANTEDWDVKTIGELLASKPNAARTGPFGSQLKHSEFVENGVPVLGIDNIVTNEFRWTSPRCLPPEKYKRFRRYRVFPDDVIITIMGTTGRVAVAPQGLQKCMSTKHLCVLSLNKEIIDPVFLWGNLLYDRKVRNQAKMSSGGAIMDGWNMGTIKNIIIRVPPRQQQLLFRSIVETFKQMTRIKLTSLEAYSHDLFSSLSQRAFRGEP